LASEGSKQVTVKRFAISIGATPVPAVTALTKDNNVAVVLVSGAKCP
jgi:flavin reductase (DIM6/NTAB) family NADH-FMN oxidoreductase RutF